MFSGIVEEAGTIVAARRDDGNLQLTVRCSFVNELSIDQSVAHNGVCLTVVDIDGDTYTVTAIQETLERSNLGRLTVGDLVNLERSMRLSDRLDGHIVQGHVDTTAVCTDIQSVDGSRYYTFEYTVSDDMAAQGYVTVEKGSVTVNGVSLTVCDSRPRSFRVAIIPYHIRAYQLLPPRRRLAGQYRIRHNRQIHRPSCVLRQVNVKRSIQASESLRLF